MAYTIAEPCIDVKDTACVDEAIFENDALPEKWKHYAQINADYFKKSE